MNVRVKLKDGSTAAVLDVAWHPEYVATTAPSTTVRFPAGAWTTEDSAKRLMKALAGPGGTPKDFADEVVSAEMPFDVLAASPGDKEPWRNFGNVVKSVPYGGGF